MLCKSKQTLEVPHGWSCVRRWGGVLIGSAALTIGAPAVNACDLACRLAEYQNEQGVEVERDLEVIALMSKPKTRTAIALTLQNDYAPVQVADRLTPNEKAEIVEADREWERPSGAARMWFCSMATTEKRPFTRVSIMSTQVKCAGCRHFSAAEGRVSYVRKGCENLLDLASTERAVNVAQAGGNHVVIDHGNGIHRRYAHLANEDIMVKAGDTVKAGERIAGMGNSGRSQERHLHFEIGHSSKAFDSCGPVRSFDRIFDPADFLKGNTR